MILHLPALLVGMIYECSCTPAENKIVSDFFQDNGLGLVGKFSLTEYVLHLVAETGISPSSSERVKEILSKEEDDFYEEADLEELENLLEQMDDEGLFGFDDTPKASGTYRVCIFVFAYAFIAHWCEAIVSNVVGCNELHIPWFACRKNGK